MLRSIAVMNIEIDDCHPTGTAAIKRILSPDRDIVYEAEPHRVLAFGMMARRPSEDKHLSGFPYGNRVNSRQNRVHD